MDDLQKILSHWTIESASPEEVKNSGAAIARQVWNLNEDFSLKCGENFQALDHHIHVSRILRDNGITASCPLPTSAGNDYLTCGDHYYVITERVSDNFLSVRPTPEDREKEYIERYRSEAGNFQNAFKRADPEFMDLMRWAAGEAEKVAEQYGEAWLPVTPISAAESAQGKPGFICSTRLSMPLPPEIRDMLSAHLKEGLMGMLTMFVAWTGSNAGLRDMTSGNIRLLNNISTQKF